MNSKISSKINPNSIALLEKAEDRFKRSDGKGLKKQLHRLFLCKTKYIKYVLAKSDLLWNQYRTVNAKTFWGKEIQVGLRDSMAIQLYLWGVLGGTEYKLSKFFIKHLKQDDVFYDVGTNYGFYTALAIDIIQTGEIHSFEPSPSIFPYLQTTFSQEKRQLFLNNLAMSDQQGMIPFFNAFFSKYSGSSTMLKTVGFREQTKYQTTQVKSTSLDKYAEKHKNPTVIKLDIEGAEGLMIKGGIKTIQSCHPVITMEIWRPHHKDNTSQLNGMQILLALGYKPFKILENGDIEMIEGDTLLTCIPKNMTGDNFVFIQH